MSRPGCVHLNWGGGVGERIWRALASDFSTKAAEENLQLDTNCNLNVFKNHVFQSSRLNAHASSRRCAIAA